MPELAEVEYYRKQWDAGLDQRVSRIHVHPNTRVFRRTNCKQLVQALPGLCYRQSWARGKQMLFRFGRAAWVGIHLGMTGKLRTENLPFAPHKHDHLVIALQKRALVFADSRQFGRVQFHEGSAPADWWTKTSPVPTERAFSQTWVRDFLARHGRLPIKAALLLQTGFPGIGNWMADEILWRARIAPARRAADLSFAETQAVWRVTRAVCRTALRSIGEDFSDPPKGWLFHQRWSRKGLCPLHKTILECQTVGGRTTLWCARCQRM